MVFVRVYVLCSTRVVVLLSSLGTVWGDGDREDRPRHAAEHNSEVQSEEPAVLAYLRSVKGGGWSRVVPLQR